MYFWDGMKFVLSLARQWRRQDTRIRPIIERMCTKVGRSTHGWWWMTKLTWLATELSRVSRIHDGPDGRGGECEERVGSRETSNVDIPVQQINGVEHLDLDAVVIRYLHYASLHSVGMDARHRRCRRRSVTVFIKRILSISILVCGSNASTSPSISCSWQVLQSTVLPMLNQSLAPAIFDCRLSAVGSLARSRHSHHSLHHLTSDRRFTLLEKFHRALVSS